MSLIPVSEKKDIWGDLPQDRKNEVLCYLKTGKASSEFLEYLDKNEEVDRKVDQTMEQMVNAIKELPPMPIPPPIRIECSSCGTLRPKKCNCRALHISLTIFAVIGYFSTCIGLIFFR
jgi:hypothetical protein